MQSMNRHSIGLPLAHVTLFGYSIYSFYGSDTDSQFFVVQCND